MTRRSWNLLKADNSTALITAQGFEVLRSGALLFWNLSRTREHYPENVETVALYPAGQWLYMSENID